MLVFGNVSLRDISFQNSTGFPIFRSESIEWLKNIIQEQPQEQTQKQTELPPPNITKPTPVQNQVIYPEIPVSERHNFVITDNRTRIMELQVRNMRRILQLYKH